MLLLIPLLPFLGFLVNASLGRRVSKAAAGAVACGAMIGSFAVSVLSVVRLVQLEPEARAIVNQVFTWIASGDFRPLPGPMHGCSFPPATRDLRQERRSMPI